MKFYKSIYENINPTHLQFLDMSVYQIYQKFYSNIDIEVFNEIVFIDPTSIIKNSKIKRIGKFSKRFLTLLNQNKISSNDISDKKDELITLLANFEGGINKVNKISDLYKLQKRYEFEIVFKNSKWTIETNFNYETSVKRYGDFTSWCTASEKYGSNYFDKYVSVGQLFVIRNIYKPNKELYQVFIHNNKKDSEFQNKRNVSGEAGTLRGFLKSESSLSDFFHKTIKLAEINALYILGREFSYTKKGDTFVFTNIDISDSNLKEIPKELQEINYEVSGNFNCSNNNLTTLKGTPEKVGGGFNCNDNNLTTLEGAPEKVGGDFYCNNLTPEILLTKPDYVKYEIQ